MNRRVFVAIDISEEARRTVTEYVSRLRAEFTEVPARWERPEKLHLTVKFAGSLDEGQLAIFTDRVKASADSVTPFRIKIAGTGAFLKHRGPSVLWLGVEQVTNSDSMVEIAKELGHQGGAFHPHITIARIKDAKKAKELIERHRARSFESGAFEVNEMVIYESELLPSGSVYKIIRRFRLRK